MTYPWSQTNTKAPKRYQLVDQVSIDGKAFISIGLRSEWGVYNRSCVVRIKPKDIDPRSPEAFKLDRQNRASWTQGSTRGVQDQKFYLDFMDEHHFYCGFDFYKPEMLSPEIILIPGPRTMMFFPAFPLRENPCQSMEDVIDRAVFECKRQLFVDSETWEELRGLKERLNIFFS